MAANRIYLQVDLNSANAQANVNALNQSLSQTGGAAEKSSAQATRSLNSVSVSVKTVTDDFSAMGAALTGLGIEKLASSMIKLTSDFSRIQLSMQAFIGSAQVAKNLFEDIRQVAQSGVFEFKDLAQTGRQMLAFGIAAKDVTGYLQALQDKVASTGGSMEELNGIAAIMGRVIEKEFVGAMDLLRKLPQQAFPIMKELQKQLSEALGKPASIEEVKKAIMDGVFEPLRLVNTIAKVAAESSKNLGQQMNDSAKAFKNLGDEVLKYAEQLGQAFEPAMVRLAQQIGELLVPLQKLAAAFANLSEEHKDMILRWAEVGAAVAALAAVFKILFTVLGPGFDLVMGLAKAFGALAIALANPEILIPLAGIATVMALMYKANGPFRQAVDSMIDGVTKFAESTWAKFKGLFESVRTEAKKAAVVTTMTGSPFQESESVYQKELEKATKFQDEAASKLLQTYASPMEAVTLKYATLFRDLEQQIEQGFIKLPHATELRDALRAGQTDEEQSERVKKMKQDRDEFLAASTEKVKGAYDAQIAYIEAMDAQSLRGKLAAIDQITQLRIDSENKVAKLQENRIEKDKVDFQQYVKERTDYLIDLGMTQAQINTMVDNRNAEATNKQAAIAQKAMDETQKLRLEGWKKANDVIIEDQKRVYDAFRDIWDEFFDAMTGKAGTVGKAMGDMFKKLAIGELKETFSSQLAAFSTQAAGYGTPEEAQPQHGKGLLGILLRRGMPPRPPMAPPGMPSIDLTDTSVSFESSSQRQLLASTVFLRGVEKWTAIVNDREAVERDKQTNAALAPLGASPAIAAMANVQGPSMAAGPDWLSQGWQGAKSWFSGVAGTAASGASAAGSWISKGYANLRADVMGGASAAAQAVGAPTNVQQAFAAMAAKYGLPPGMLEAIAQTESGFNPKAVGPVTKSGETAVGLMQLMPKTAAAYGVTDRTNAMQSLDAGAHLLHDLHQQFPDDPAKVIAAYHAGAGAVTKYGGVPPYADTQAYVPKVMGYMQQYAQQAAPVSIEGMAGLPAAGSVAASPAAATVAMMSMAPATAAGLQNFGWAQPATITPVSQEQLAGLPMRGSSTSAQFAPTLQMPDSVTQGAVPQLVKSITGTSDAKKAMGVLALAGGAVNKAATPGAKAAGPLGALGSLYNLKSAFGIGTVAPSTVPAGAGGGVLQGLGLPAAVAPVGGTTFSSVATSKAVTGLMTAGGLAIASQGLQRRNAPFTAIGGALAGAGMVLSSSKLVAAAGGTGPALGAGLAIGGGAGLLAAGIQKGGGAGLGMDIGGGALAGAGIGFLVGGPLGAAIGAGIGAAAGAVTGVVRMFIKTETEKIRAQIKQVYGIDISNVQLLSQIKKVIDDTYGGNVAVGIRSQQVQDIVRLYALSTGQTAGLPRPEYSATFAQSAAGGTQLQATYQGGQLVQNPYSGPTTYQYQTAVTSAEGLKAGTSLGVPGATGMVNQSFANLPTTSSSFVGGVVNAMQQNPAAVSSASAAAARAGDSRLSTSAAMLEPLTSLS